MTEQEKNLEGTLATEKIVKRVSKKISAIILVSTLVVSLIGGYYISREFLWNTVNEQKVEEQLNFAKGKVNDKPNDPGLRVDLGFAYFLNKDYKNSVKEYKTAINLDKKNFTAHLNLAIVYDRMDEPNKSLEMATKASKLVSQDYKSHLLMGVSFRKLKNFDDAEKELETAKRLSPGNVDVIYEIGMVAEKQGKLKEAKAIYKECLSYDPEFEKAQEALKRIQK